MLLARIEVGHCLNRVLLEFLEGPLTGETMLNVRSLPIRLTNVQPDPPFPLFGDDQLAYRLSRHPKDLTDPRVRPLRMGFHEPDDVSGPPAIVPFLSSSSHGNPLLSLHDSRHLRSIYHRMAGCQGLKDSRKTGKSTHKVWRMEKTK